METFVLCEQSKKKLETVEVFNNTADVLFHVCQLIDNQLVPRLEFSFFFFLVET